MKILIIILAVTITFYSCEKKKDYAVNEIKIDLDKDYSTCIKSIINMETLHHWLLEKNA